MAEAKRVKLMRGNESSRLSVIPAQGEQISTIDELKLYLGDGNKAGGFTVNADNTIAVWTDQTDATKKLSLAWWIAHLNGAEATIRIPRGTHEVLYDMTIPENICLKFDKGAKLSIADTKTLTLDRCTLEAGAYHIFTGEGDVLAGAWTNGTITVTRPPKVDVAYAEWFGAKADYNMYDIPATYTDNADAFAKVLKISNVIQLMEGDYAYTPPWSINFAKTDDVLKKVIIKGKGITKTRLFPLAVAENAIEVGTTHSTTAEFSHFELQGNSTCLSGIVLGSTGTVETATASSRNIFTHISVKSFSKAGAAGIKLVSGYYNRFYGVILTYNDRGFEVADGGVVTSLSFCDNCVLNQNKYGFYAIKTFEEAWIQETFFEGNTKYAVYVENAFGARLKIENCYLEQNGTQDDNTTGLYYLHGSPEPYGSLKCQINGCSIHEHPTGIAALDFAYIDITIEPSSNVWTTANEHKIGDGCYIHFFGLHDSPNSFNTFVDQLSEVASRVDGYFKNEFTGTPKLYSNQGVEIDSHIRSVGDAPTVTIDPGMPEGSIAELYTDFKNTDMSGVIAITVPANHGWESSTVASLTFSKPYASPPLVTLMPYTSQAAEIQAVCQPYIEINTSTGHQKFTIKRAVTDNTLSGTSYWAYHVIG